MHSKHDLSSGFISGTLVRVRGGSRPINEIRAGDEVLAQQEEGPQVYLPVAGVQTGPAEICLVELIPAADVEIARAARSMISDASLFGLLMAKGQPLLAEDIGWVRADELMAWKQGMPSLPTWNGRGAAAAGSFGGVRRQAADEGWFTYVPGADTGFVLGCRDGAALEPMPERELDVVSDIDEWWEPENALRCDVYALRFEHPVAYFVGEIGATVHSSDAPPELRRIRR